MNQQKLNELAKEAGVLADYGEDIKVGRFAIGGSYQSMEKFAELIVRECQRQVEQYIYECGEIASIPDTVIMKHFGVEEDEDDETCPKCGDSWGGTSCGADCGWITGAEE